MTTKHDAMASPMVGEMEHTAVDGTEIRRRLLLGLPVVERRLRLNGIDTAVLEGGEGPPMLLLHGPGEYGAKFLRVIPELVRHYRIVVPDLPGHGATESVSVERPDQVLDWLDDLIECTCTEPPVVVGQIMSGSIALRYAIRHPDRVNRLILVDSLGLAPFNPDPAFGQVLFAYTAEPNGETHDALWSLCAYDLDRLTSDGEARWDSVRSYNIDRAAAALQHDTQRAMLEMFGMNAIPVSELRSISIPVALIWGRHDKATLLSVAEAAHAAYGWPLYVIEEAADDPPYEQPDAFLRALEQVLSVERAT